MINTNEQQCSILHESFQSSYSIKVEAFEGPLDLLLHLIKKNEVEISDIPIASITRQYLEYIELMKELNLDIAGEFLVMASTLLQIKSRTLLPFSEYDETGENEEDDPRAELVRRLLEYQKYKEAALALNERELLGRDVFARKFHMHDSVDGELEEETLEVELFQLVEAFQRILAEIPDASFHEVEAVNFSVADRINDIMDVLQGKEFITFDEIFKSCLTREYFIASFLALLELCKLKMINIVQPSSYGTIWIKPTVADTDL